jgi:hypothetical protein
MFDFENDLIENIETSLSDSKLFEIEMSQFSNLLKVLNCFKKSEYILINNSKINQQVSNYIIMCDLEHIIGKGISFEINNPSSKLELLKKLIDKSDSTIVFEDDIENQRYIVKNTSIQIYLQKIDIDHQIPKEFESNRISMFGNNIVISSLMKKNIQSLFKNRVNKDSMKNKYTLLFKDTQLHAIEISETALISLSDKKVSADNSDLKLLSSTFLEVDGSNYILYIICYDDEFWLMTKVETDLIMNGIPFKIMVFEPLVEEYENSLI